MTTFVVVAGFRVPKGMENGPLVVKAQVATTVPVTVTDDVPAADAPPEYNIAPAQAAATRLL